MHRNKTLIMEIVYSRKRCACIQRGEIAFLVLRQIGLQKKRLYIFGRQ